MTDDDVIDTLVRVLWTCTLSRPAHEVENDLREEFDDEVVDEALSRWEAEIDDIVNEGGESNASR